MKAVMCETLGPPEQLVLKDVPEPGAPGPGQVLIAVKAAGVNFPDTLIIEGRYQTKPGLPFAPGGEVAGTVLALGDGATGLDIGQRVLALTTYGGFAEQVIADAAAVFAIPDAMPDDVAAGFILTYSTSYHALKQRARLAPGEKLVVLGAGGGVGLTAVELGHVMGAEVIAAASDEEKLALARARGAARTINYGGMEPRAIKDAIKDATQGHGADVLYDPMGGDWCEPAFRAMAPNGRYLVVGFTAGIPKLPTNLALIKGCDLVGVFWGAFARQDPALHRANMDDLFRWYEAGRLKPHISAVYPLADAAKALRVLSSRQAKGKLILQVG